LAVGDGAAVCDALGATLDDALGATLDDALEDALGAAGEPEATGETEVAGLVAPEPDGVALTDGRTSGEGVPATAGMLRSVRIRATSVSQVWSASGNDCDSAVTWSGVVAE
jgi:hypothetical protein